ncbi:hypothetical protein OWV82_008510 [Melia azedarach]|uniref:Uncharacterized protein n=1 Tax=Melia azedarach TaxID=155640 RepID=A0ACC1YC03_MELAZ|nr:hypothetical protein OWV82_008510 [Melia azedarach]
MMYHELLLSASYKITLLETHTVLNLCRRAKNLQYKATIVVFTWRMRLLLFTFPVKRFMLSHVIVFL